MKISYTIIPTKGDCFRFVKFIGNQLAQEQPDFVCSDYKILNHKVALLMHDNCYGLFDLEKVEPITDIEFDQVELEPFSDGMALVHLFKGINYWTVDVRKKDLTPKLNPYFCDRQINMLKKNPLLYKDIEDAYLTLNDQKDIFERAAKKGISQYKEKAFESGESFGVISNKIRNMHQVITERNATIKPNREKLFEFDNRIGKN